MTFDTAEIVEGCEVRTKATPIYSAGSVAINFSSGTPLVNFNCFVNIFFTDRYFDGISVDFKRDLSFSNSNS